MMILLCSQLDNSAWEALPQKVQSSLSSKVKQFRRFFLCLSKINKTWKLFLDLELILGSRPVRQKLWLSLNANSAQCVKNIWIVWFWGLCNFEDLQLLPMSEKLLLPTQLLLLNAQRHSSFSHCLRSSLLELGGLVVKKQIWSLDRARAPMCLKLAFCIFICDW